MGVNWDDDIPNIWENKIDVPTHYDYNQSFSFIFDSFIIEIPALHPGSR